MQKAIICIYKYRYTFVARILIMFRLLKLGSRDRTRDSCKVKNGVLELLLAYFNVFITINVLIIHRYFDILYVLLVHYTL